MKFESTRRSAEESWRAGNPGKRRDAREREEKNSRAARALSPGGRGVFHGCKKNSILGGIELQKTAPTLGTHGTLGTKGVRGVRGVKGKSETKSFEFREG